MRTTATIVAGCLAAAALSALVVAPAPAYDPWAWLLWGRELTRGTLSTAEGPSFKPLAVAVCAVLSLFGGAAPVLWVIVARAGALLALVLAFRLGRRLAAEWLGAAGATAAGALAATAVALTGAFLGYAAEGMVVGLLLALGLAGVEAWRAGRPRGALACAFGACLLHVEAWPFAAAFGLWVLLRRPRERMLVLAAAVAVPVLWIVPEWIGSGNPLRSGERARVPNLGQPALADLPAAASLREAAGLVLWPLWLGAAVVALAAARTLARGGGDRGSRRPARPDEGVVGAGAAVAVGVLWIALVAAMAQLVGFSGEARYAAPGAALIALGGAVGLVAAVRWLAGERVEGLPGGAREVAGGAGRWRLGPPTTAAALALLGLAAVFAVVERIGELDAVGDRQAHQWRLASDLGDAVAAAGGRDAILDCGIPYVGSLRGPLLAYRLDIAKRAVRPDDPPVAPAVVFRAARRTGGPVTPAVPPTFEPLAVAGEWRVAKACRVRMP